MLPITQNARRFFKAKNARAVAPPKTRATNSHRREPIPARLPLWVWMKSKSGCLPSVGCPVHVPLVPTAGVAPVPIRS